MFDEGFDHLVHVAAGLDLPDGLSAEVFGGAIVVAPWKPAFYAKRMRAVSRQLEEHLPKGHEVFSAPCRFRFPDLEAAIGPDCYVYDPELAEPDAVTVPGEALALALTLTTESSRPYDLGPKLDVYGRGGVLVHVLADMRDRTLTAYSDPSRERGYRTRTAVEFGEPLRLPEPFDFELDTTAFAAKL